ncbi:MAG: hypothetical protein ABIM82_02285 [candidate division WOR-3 bacterium]
MTKFVKNREFSRFNEGWDRRSILFIFPKQDKKGNTFVMNKLSEMVSLTMMTNEKVAAF